MSWAITSGLSRKRLDSSGWLWLWGRIEIFQTKAPLSNALRNADTDHLICFLFFHHLPQYMLYNAIHITQHQQESTEITNSIAKLFPIGLIDYICIFR